MYMIERLYNKYTMCLFRYIIKSDAYIITNVYDIAVI